MLEEHDWENDKLPSNPEIVSDLLLHLDKHKSMESNEIHPRVLKKTTDIITVSLFINGLGSLKKSQ